MIDVKQAVATAVAHVRELFALDMIGDIRLEEVEPSDDGQVWWITVSFLREGVPEGVAAMMAPVIGRVRERQFKRVSIRAADGEFQAVKIRET